VLTFPLIGATVCHTQTASDSDERVARVGQGIGSLAGVHNKG